MRKVRKYIIYGLLFLGLFKISSLHAGDFILLTEQDVQALQQKRANKSIHSVLQILNELAQHALTEPIRTITSVRAPFKDIDIHAYYSESPYWWPDSANLDGPFIRHDGLRYPGRFLGHKNLLMNMYRKLTALSLAAYFLDDTLSAQKAREILKAWFINPKTRMAPHLQYAQAVRHKSNGRSFGIIETHRFVELMPALRFLQASGCWPAEEQAHLKEWLRVYLKWLTQSDFGIKEKMHGNNHSTWWSAQVMAIARFLENDSLFEATRQHVVDYLFEKQIEPPGRFPLEEERTKSLSYTIFNLNAHAYIAQMVYVCDNENLWLVKNSRNVALADVVQYVTPYLKRPDTWPHKQITPVARWQIVFSLFYGNLEPEYLGLYRRYAIEIPNYKEKLVHDPFSALFDLVCLSKQ